MRTFPMLLATAAASFAAEPPVPKFTHYTLDPKIQIGYGLAIADVDGDKRLDILLADKRQFVWYQNPGTPPPGAATFAPPIWSKFVLSENLTEKDNVCIAAQDIDGDGKAEVAVGAEWNPGDTEKSGAVFHLIAPEDRQQRWTPVKFPSVEPTTHRMRWIKLGEGNHGARGEHGEKEKAAAPSAPSVVKDSWGLVVLPLHGRGNKNGEGAPVKVLLYHPPTPLNDPQGEWKSEVVDESMHMTHNFHLLNVREGSPNSLLLCGKEGLKFFFRKPERWEGNHALRNDGGNQESNGAGEVRTGFITPHDDEGRVRMGYQFIATIEPMHGNALAWYAPIGARKTPYRRVILTDKLTEGHALATGDVLGVKGDQIVVGWRGTPGKAGSTTGVALWTPLDAQGEKWRETVIDSDGMACEDLQLADLDADGDLDIVAAGRATKNVKIYWNETAR